VADVRADDGHDLDGVTCAQVFPAAGRDSAVEQEAVEVDALVAQGVALVDADDDRRQAFDVFTLGEAGPGEGVVGVEGVDAIMPTTTMSLAGSTQNQVP
jgi:hypothetical protein